MRFPTLRKRSLATCLHRGGALELGQSGVDQVEARRERPIVRSHCAACRAAREASSPSRRPPTAESSVTGDALDRVTIAVARRESIAAYTPAGSSRRIRSTSLIDSTNSRQSMAPRNRRLPMLLLIETWSAACSLVLRLDELLDRPVRFREPLLDPRERRAPAPRSVPAAGARAPQRTRCPSADSIAPCRQ